jgi:hypothetical protein
MKKFLMLSIGAAFLALLAPPVAAAAGEAGLTSGQATRLDLSAQRSRRRYRRYRGYYGGPYYSYYGPRYYYPYYYPYYRRPGIYFGFGW